MSIMGIQREYHGMIASSHYLSTFYISLYYDCIYNTNTVVRSLGQLSILPGWYIYTEAVRAAGGVVSNGGIINTPGWDIYKTTVADGTFWGAYITGNPSAVHLESTGSRHISFDIGVKRGEIW